MAIEEMGVMSEPKILVEYRWIADAAMSKDDWTPWQKFYSLEAAMKAKKHQEKKTGLHEYRISPVV
jgi:hypothetical protein